MSDARSRGSVEPESTVVSTPEGDNEFAPDQPLRPELDGLQQWPSNPAMEYDKDRAAPEKDSSHHTGMQRVIDEISTGKILP